jgi:hypothetical protein
MMESTCLLNSKSNISTDDGQYMPSENTYCPSSGELYDFDMRRHVMSIICGAL